MEMQPCDELSLERLATPAIRSSARQGRSERRSDSPRSDSPRSTTRFKRQPAAPIHAHHSIAKDSDHNAGNGETKQYRSTGEHQTFNEGATAFNEPNEPGHTEASTTRMNVGGALLPQRRHICFLGCVRLQSTCEASRCVRENLHGLHG